MKKAQSTVVDGQHLALVRRDSQEYVTRKNGINNTVAVVALDKGKNLVLINRYYPSVRGYVLELPTMPFDGRQSPSQAAAKRLEDYGYTSPEPPVVVGSAANSPGLTDEMTYFFLATGVEEVSDNKDESGSVELVPPTIETPPIIRDVIKGKRLAASTVFTGLFLAGLRIYD